MEAMIGISAFLISYPIILILLRFIEFNFGTPIAIIFGLLLLLLIICTGCYIIRKGLEEFRK